MKARTYMAEKSRKSPVKKLRNAKMLADAAAGMTVTDIAKKYDMSRSKASAVLNSDQVKAKVKEIDNKLAQGLDDAIDTVLRAVRVDYNAAYDLLKNFGSMKTSVDLNHQFPKPVVIKRRNGEEVVLGTTADQKEDE